MVDLHSIHSKWNPKAHVWYFLTKTKDIFNITGVVLFQVAFVCFKENFSFYCLYDVNVLFNFSFFYFILCLLTIRILWSHNCYTITFLILTYDANVCRIKFVYYYEQIKTFWSHISIRKIHFKKTLMHAGSHLSPRFHKYDNTYKWDFQSKELVVICLVSRNCHEQAFLIFNPHKLDSHLVRNCEAFSRVSVHCWASVHTLEVTPVHLNWHRLQMWLQQLRSRSQVKDIHMPVTTKSRAVQRPLEGQKVKGAHGGRQRGYRQWGGMQEYDGKRWK